MTAITTAARLLRVAADELKNAHTLGGDWGNELEALDAYNEHMATATTLEHMARQCLAQIEEPAQPVCWIRFCSDGSTEGPIMHSQICEARKTSGAWTPLYAGAAPAAVAEPADERAAVLDAARDLIELRDEYAQKTQNAMPGNEYWSERFDAKYQALAAALAAASALEAPAAPACDLFDCEVRPHPLRYPLAAYHHAPGNGPLHATWQDKPHRIVYDLVAAVRHYAALAAAPQAPAVPVAVTTRAELEKLQGGAGSMATIFPADASGFPVRLYAEPAAPAVDADGARYRYLRDEHIGDDPESINLPPARKSGLDAAVDAAIAAQAAAKGASES